MFDTDNKPEPQWTEVDTAHIRVENQSDFDGPWLAWQRVHPLKLDQWLEAALPSGREKIAWSKMILILVICRLCHPSSELDIAEHYYPGTALQKLLGIPADKVYDERLYRALDNFYRTKMLWKNI